MKKPKPPFALSREDKTSPLWHRLMTHWEGRLDTLRAQNDSDKLESQTANLRGKIAEVKAMLSLDEDLPIIEPPQ